MNGKKRTYICIDLKSFYASVECVRRHLDPLTTNLVVADVSRTEKTICLAVSPALKQYGIGGRARLFEVVQKVEEINRERLKKTRLHSFSGEGYDSRILSRFPELKLCYIAATPHMQDYIDVSSKIYSIYLKYVAKEDIHVYSIDEVFMDVTDYLGPSRMTAHQMAMLMIRDVLKNTGITATAGIGTNLYLAKVAMDILAKHVPADKDGVRIAQLDELSYRKELWTHRPLKDFWRVGRGYQEKLESLGLYTMGDIAKCSIGKDEDYYNENLLFSKFGVNAELLIDHAWGEEPTTISDIKKYHPSTNSMSIGQVLHQPYGFQEARTIVTEMADSLSMALFEKKKVTREIELVLDYDVKNLEIFTSYSGETTEDYLGRKVIKPGHGNYLFEHNTSSTKELVQGFLRIYDAVSDPRLLIRKIRVVALNLKDETSVEDTEVQLSLFEDNEKREEKEKEEKEDREKEYQVQKAIFDIKKKYGKNAVLKLVDCKKKATGKERNKEIGGHKA